VAKPPECTVVVCCTTAPDEFSTNICNPAAPDSGTFIGAHCCLPQPGPEGVPVAGHRNIPAPHIVGERWYGIIHGAEYQ